VEGKPLRHPVRGERPGAPTVVREAPETAIEPKGVPQDIPIGPKGLYQPSLELGAEVFQ
jgi:hypothetical protein